MAEPTVSWHERAKAVRFPHAGVHRRALCRCRIGRDVRVDQSRHRQVLAQVAAGDAADIDRAVAAARAAFARASWARQPPAQRKNVLQQLRRADPRARGRAGAARDARHGQADRRFSLSVDIPAAAHCIRWYAEAVDKIYDEVAPTGPRRAGD